jgi:hypothetical protein
MSARPCKQPLMVGTILKVYPGYTWIYLRFLFQQEPLKDIIIRSNSSKDGDRRYDDFSIGNWLCNVGLLAYVRGV